MVHEPRRENAHEPGQCNSAYIAVFQRRAEYSVIFFLAEALALARPGSKLALLSPFEASRFRLVRCDERDVKAGGVLHKRAHVAASSGDQDADTSRVTHCALRTNPRLNSTCRLCR